MLMTARASDARAKRARISGGRLDRAAEFLTRDDEENRGRSAEEDEGLRASVGKHKGCRERWRHHLDPSVVEGDWTQSEDTVIVSMQRRVGNKWAEIAKHLDGRTENATKRRWKFLERGLQEEEGRNQQEKEDHSALRNAPALPLSGMGKEPARNAQQSHFTVGTGTDVRSERRGWLADEDERLKEAVEYFGDRSWRDVARSVRTRSHSQCHQRWRETLRPGLVKGTWGEDEDKKLLLLISQGVRNWATLSREIPGRTSKQCRERWTHHLDPSLRRESWTAAEDLLLISAEARLGTRWAAIAREIPGRTEHTVKERVKTLSKGKQRLERASSQPESVSSEGSAADRKCAAASKTGVAGLETPSLSHPPQRPIVSERSRGVARVTTARGIDSCNRSEHEENVEAGMQRSAENADRRQPRLQKDADDAQLRWGLDAGVRLPAKAVATKGGDRTIGALISAGRIATPRTQDTSSDIYGRGGKTGRSVASITTLTPDPRGVRPVEPVWSHLTTEGAISPPPAQKNFSNWAPVIRDAGSDASKVGVESGPEAHVNLDPPYGDVSLPDYDGHSLLEDIPILMGPSDYVDVPGTEDEAHPSPQTAEQHARLDEPEMMSIVGTSSSLIEALAASVLDSGYKEDASFPYF